MLMEKTVAVDRFYPLLMQTHWYPETIARYFEGDYRAKYDEIIDAFISRDVVRCRHNHYLTTAPS